MCSLQLQQTFFNHTFERFHESNSVDQEITLNLNQEITESKLIAYRRNKGGKHV